jgi:hypothetical protein
MVARFLIPALVAPALLASGPFAAPARAAVSFGLGQPASQTLAFEGLTNPADFSLVAGTDQLDAKLTLSLFLASGSNWYFAYKVENQASGAFGKARINGFGFNVDEAVTGSLSSGMFDREGSGQVTPGYATDLCFMSASAGDCHQSTGGGLKAGDSTGGWFRLSFDQPQSVITLSNLYVRWQEAHVKKDIPQEAVLSMTAISPEPAPEPAAWALFIVGFGAVGFALRRKVAGNQYFGTIWKGLKI